MLPPPRFFAGAFALITAFVSPSVAQESTTPSSSAPPIFPNVSETSATLVKPLTSVTKIPSQKITVQPWQIPASPVDSTGGFVAKTKEHLLLAGHLAGSPPTAMKVWSLPITVPMRGDGAWKQSDVAVPMWASTVSWGETLVCAGGVLDGKLTDKVMLLGMNGTVTTSPLPKLPRPLAGAGASVIGSTLYLFGGFSSVQPAVLEKAFWTLDLARPGATWTEETATFPGPGRAFAATTEQYGMLCVFGGVVAAESGALRTSREAWVFRPVPLEGTQRSGWDRLADVPNPTARAAAIPLGQAHVMLVGGTHSENFADLLSLAPSAPDRPLLFHVITDAWAELDQEVNAATPLPVKFDKSVMLIGSATTNGAIIGAQEINFPRIVRNLAFLDWLIVGGYFVLVAAIGFHFSRKQETSDEFSLGNRKVAWWAAGISMFATGASAISFMAIPALAFSTNLVWMLPLVVLIPGYFVTAYLVFPLLRRMNLTSTYEYLEHRFNRTLRLVASAQCIVYQTFGRAAVVLTLPALAISAVTGMNVFVSVLVMGLLTTIYTALGGFEAVIWTEVFQGLLKFVAPLVMIVVAIRSLPGGLGEFVSAGKAYHKFDFAMLTWDVSLPAVWILLIGTFLTTTAAVAGDQPIIQRVFSSPLHEVRRVNIMSVTCGIVIGVIVNVLGVVIFCYFRAHPEKLDPTAQNDQIVPLFTTQAMPVGFAGLVVAAIFASAMATVASAMNSVATIFTEDFFMKLRPQAPDKTRLFVLKSTSYLVGAIGTAMALFLAGQSLKSMMVIFSQTAALLGGGIVGVYSLGMFTRRANGFGAIVGAIASMGVTLFVKLYTPLHWATYGPIAILSCIVVGYLASFLSVQRKSLEGLTIYTSVDPSRKVLPVEANA